MAEQVFYLLTYDIADPRRLARVAKLMESVGERVQDSVFEAYLDAAGLESLTKKVLKKMNKDKDSVRIYPLCAACKGKLRCLGQGRPTPAPQVTIV